VARVVSAAWDRLEQEGKLVDGRGGSGGGDGAGAGPYGGAGMFLAMYGEYDDDM
jgi:hypothetical protein